MKAGEKGATLVLSQPQPPNKKRHRKPLRAPSYSGLRPSSGAASAAKRANRATRTKPELQLYIALCKLGLRPQTTCVTLPGKPDLVFKHNRVVIFCDGDFWHGRNWSRLKHQLTKRHNADYWIAKIRYNRSRDRLRTQDLQRAGWTVIRVWERDIASNASKVAQAIGRVLSSCPSSWVTVPRCMKIHQRQADADTKIISTRGTRERDW